METGGGGDRYDDRGTSGGPSLNGDALPVDKALDGGSSSAPEEGSVLVASSPDQQLPQVPSGDEASTVPPPEAAPSEAAPPPEAAQSETAPQSEFAAPSEPSKPALEASAPQFAASSRAAPPPEAAPPTAPPGEEAAHPLEVDASSAAPHEPTAPELDDSAEQLEAELEKAKERVAWLEQRSKDQQEKELARQREELQERIAAAERQMEEQKAALADLQPRRRELEANVKTFNEIHLKEDQEMWNIEKKLRYAAITRQEEAHRAIAVKQERTRALLDERRIWFEAIQEEQAARKERQLAAVQQQLESEGSAHLLKASASLEAAEDTGALAKSFLDGEIPVLDEHEEVNPHAMTEMINGRRQEVHERRMAEMAAERKSIGEDRLANHQQTRSARSRRRIEKSRSESLSARIARELGCAAFDDAAHANDAGVDISSSSGGSGQGQDIEWLNSLRRVATLARGEGVSTQHLEVLTQLGNLGNQENRGSVETRADNHTAEGGKEVDDDGGDDDDDDDDDDIDDIYDGPDMEQVVRRIRENQEATGNSLKGLNGNLDHLRVEQKWIDSNHGERWSEVEKNMLRDRDIQQKLEEDIEHNRERIKDWDKKREYTKEGDRRDIWEAVVVDVSRVLAEDVVDEMVRAVVADYEKMRQYVRKHINMKIIGASVRMRLASTEEPTRTSGLLMSILGEMQDHRSRRDRELAARQADAPCTRMSQRLTPRSAPWEEVDVSEVPETVPDDSEFVVRMNVVDRTKSGAQFNGRVRVEYEEAEAALWAKARVVVNELAIDKRNGGPSALSFSCPATRMPCKPRCCNIAVGTTKGATAVYRLPPPCADSEAAQTRAPMLVRLGTRPEHAKDRVAVTEIKWSLDGRSSLITLDAYHVVRTFVLEARITENDPKHSRDVFPRNQKDVSVPGLSLRGYKLTNKELLRHDFTRGSEVNVKSWDREVLIADKQLYPCGVAFHSSMTLLGVQPSIMMSTRSGVLVKWNHVDDRGEVCYGDSCAARAPGNPDVAEHILAVEADGNKVVRREFFEAHRSRVLFLDFLDFSSLTMVSLDEEGLVALWNYSEEYFTGNLYFRPQKTMRLDLMLYDRTPGDDRDKKVVYEWTPGSEIFNYNKLRASKDVADLGYFQLHDVAIETSPFGKTRRIYTLWDDSQAMLHTLVVNGAPSTTDLPDGTILTHSVVPGTQRRLAGGILQAELSQTGKEIAILVSYSAFHESIPQVPERLVLYLFDPADAAKASGSPSALRDGSLGVLPHRIIHPVTPRRATPKEPVHRPAFSLSPVMDSTGSDYAYILDYDALFVYSVATGKQLMRIDPLASLGYLKQIVDVFVSQDHSYATMLMPENETVPLMRIHVPYNDEDEQEGKAGRGEEKGAEETKNVDEGDAAAASGSISSSGSGEPTADEAGEAVGNGAAPHEATGGVVLPSAGPGSRLKRLASHCPRWTGTERNRRAGVSEDVFWDHREGVRAVTLNILEGIIRDEIGKSPEGAAAALDRADALSDGENAFELTSSDASIPPYGTVEPVRWPTHASADAQYHHQEKSREVE